ncbi:MAG: hypothetical protein IJG68_01730 [Bacilli bacterium]|nr:hypothetical protein [Bacilli bacterium]
MLKFEIKVNPYGKRTHKVHRNGESQKRFGHRKATTSQNKLKDVPINHGYHLEDYNRHVVYEHYYDNEEVPFYVGEGTLQRAFVLCGNRRTSHYNEKAKDINLIKVKIVAIDVSTKEALELETKLINKYKRISDGGSLINVDYKRGGGRRKSLERRIYQYDIKGNLLTSYCSAAEAERITGIKASNISLCAKGHKAHNTAGGYKWRFNDRFEIEETEYKSYVRKDKTNLKMSIKFD